MPRHLLVTNDFPPKVGGIQNYLWELWRRLPAEDVVVYTTPYRNASAFDAAQDFEIVRSKQPWLLGGPRLTSRINRLARHYEADLVVIDPALPAGLAGRSLELPYGVVVHGAEAAIPARLPVARLLLKRVLERSQGIIAAGNYVARECSRIVSGELPTFVVPPGVDATRFRPFSDSEKVAARQRLGLSVKAPLVVSISRLVPRKGMDTLVRASAELSRRHKQLQVVIGGAGRDSKRLKALVKRLAAPVTLTGRLSDQQVADLYGSADVFAMLCRTRWGGLEQEGFGIVFVEAAAAGIPQVAGSSGGAHEAVSHNVTGLVLDDATPTRAAEAIDALLNDADMRQRLGTAARRRACEEFSYDVLARRLGIAIAAMSA